VSTPTIIRQVHRFRSIWRGGSANGDGINISAASADEAFNQAEGRAPADCAHIDLYALVHIGHRAGPAGTTADETDHKESRA